MLAAVESKHHIWLNNEGKDILGTIKVFFANEPADIQQRKSWTPHRVISLVKLHWNCQDVKDEHGQLIGGHVPSFSEVGKQHADISVKFDGR